ncbi:hypothetical protein ASE36_03495 [Rhizobium sp. Root274]|uniref:hypothetical protein n=1 Tax=unclassified Rhizobium TaxID=2613769 RepID=UPI000712ACF3|nr:MULTISPECIES: hypothetical protein [unclassified Rhizobium]KQW31337.1 hypothetical protein ASC71_03495 [Rhizobium sp. Root1240]KRD32881.1 hypothetical protein ASE36_03495 [Rhizobium sp. Root274]
MNCANFCLPYPDELAKELGATGFVMSIRRLFELLAREADDKDPVKAALLRQAAQHYPDTYPDGEIIIRNSLTNIVAEEDDWDDLTDSQKIHRGNVNAAIANVDRIRYELEMMIDSYDDTEELTRLRRELATIAV